MLKRLPLAAIQLTGFGRAIRDIDPQARRSARDSAHYAKLSDAQLYGWLQRMRDEVANAWARAAQASSFVVPVMDLIQSQGGKGFATRIRGGTDDLASAGVARGAYAWHSSPRRTH